MLKIPNCYTVFKARGVKRQPNLHLKNTGKTQFLLSDTSTVAFLKAAK